MFKILVIEDEDSIRENIAELLELNQYEVIQVPDGFSGIQQILSQEPDLVICDIMMPMIDGYEVLRLARKNPVSANIPFIFLSAKANQADVRTGMSLGADDYLTKPFLADDLLNSVKGRIARRQSLQKEAKQRLLKVKESAHTIASHEYNTPLNGILGSVNLLIECYDHLSKEEVAEMLQVIKTSGEQLNRLYKNMMLHGRLKAYSTDELTYRRGSTTDISRLISTKAKSLAITYARPEDLVMELEHCSVEASEEDLLKITEELLDNAFKYSAKGERVIIKAYTIANFCIIEVQDQGRGMTREELSSTGPFTQFKRETHQQQGLGLGIHLAEQLSQLNGGSLHLRSKEPKGLIAEVKLPLK